MHRAFAVWFLLMAAVSQNAWAAGKAGLWTVTSTWQFGMRFVPQALVSLAQQQRLKPPVSGQPFTHYVCMTPGEADGSLPLHLNNRDLDCVNRTVRARGGMMEMESICHGPLEGVGHAQITWRGNQHFDGSYDFKGHFRGDAARMSSRFNADWLGSDCKGVRPFIPPTQ